MLLEKIKSKIDKAEIISFDIFDTLLVRPYINPNDLFDHLGMLENINNFRNIREKAFRLAIDKYCNNNIEEVNIEQIYANIPDEYKYMKDKELDLEYQVLQQNIELKEVWDYAISKNKKIIVVSDMFLPKQFIEKLLLKNQYTNYEKLYLSSEYKKLKYTGNLFKIILNEYNISPEKILHIGDNNKSDFEIPNKLNIKCIKYKSIISQFFDNNKKAKKFILTNQYSLTISIIFGCLAILNQQKQNYWQNLGANYGGPFIFAYLYWLKNLFEHDNINEILFVARDGYSLQKAFSIIDKDKKYKTHYFYAPRIISLCATLDIEDKLNASDFECIDTIKTIINYYSAKTNTIQIPELKSKQDYLNFWMNNKNKYKQLALNEKHKYKKYLSTLNITENKLAFVDIMTSFFTAQKLISDIYGYENIIGYYYLVSKFFNVNTTNLIYKNYTNKLFNIKFAELLFTSPEAPIKQKKNNKPVYKNVNKYDKIRMQVYPDISNGEIDFTKTMINIFDKYLIQLDLNIISDWLNDFEESLNTQDYKYLKQIKHSWNANHNTYCPLFESLTFKNKILKILQILFSSKNRNNHKVITIFGIKIKLKKNKNYLIKKIFSIKNTEDNIYKIIKIFGIKIKLKNQSEILYNKLSSKLNHMENEINLLNEKHRFVHKGGILDFAPDSFKNFILSNNMPAIIANLKKGLNDDSLKIIDLTLHKIINLPDWKYAINYFVDEAAFQNNFETEKEKEFSKLLIENEQIIKNKYKLAKNDYDMEVFLFHHGLKYAPASIKKYVKGKDFIDAGAYIGDSALIFLENYARKVYSFEISEHSSKDYIETMKINNIPENKYKLEKIALTNESGSAVVFDDGTMSVRISDNGDIIKTTSLDEYLENKDVNIGFIKADVEGSMYKTLQGMQKTIKKFRPVLSLSIYHSPEEFFKTKPLLDDITKDLNYTIKIDCHFPSCYHIYGTVIWAYPQELDN